MESSYIIITSLTTHAFFQVFRWGVLVINSLPFPSPNIPPGNILAIYPNFTPPERWFMGKNNP